jgi:hypothetical protein
MIQDATSKLPASRGLSLFKYLLLHHKKEYPCASAYGSVLAGCRAETARNSLNVAIHSLRRPRMPALTRR